MVALKAVIFDLDGTLLDSAPDIKNALNKTLAAYQHRAITLDEVKSIVGDGLLASLERAFALTGEPLPSPQLYPRLQEFLGHYRDLTPDPEQIYPHAIETMDKLRDAGVKLALCTNKQEAASLRLLDQLNLARYFSFVAGGDTFVVHKPNPGHITGILEKIGVEAAHTVMVGDSRNDVLAAKGAGVAALVLTHGYGTNVEELSADGMIDSFADLDSALERLGFKVS